MVAPHRKGRKKPKTQDGRKLRPYRRRWKVDASVWNVLSKRSTWKIIRLSPT